MKRISILFKILLITTSLTLSGNLHADKPKVKGYYINKNGDKINATIEVYTQLMSKKLAEGSYQQGCEYYDKKGKSVKLTHQEVEEFGFSYLEEKYVFRFVPVKQDLINLGHANDGAFCKLLLEDACELYSIK